MAASARILGHGIDLVDVARIASMRARLGDRFLERCFTDDEAEYALARPKRTDEHLAARFAAKEAALKAIGTGWTRGIAWTDVSVRSEPSGRPGLLVAGVAGEYAAELGIDRWHLSLSHTGGLAIASVIAEGAAS